jgi:hypothetical protein
MYIGLGVAGLAAWWAYNNWATVSAALPSTAPNPLANNIVPSSTAPPVNSSLVNVPVTQTPVAPGTTVSNPPAVGPAPAITQTPSVSISAAFPLTTAALAAAPAGAYDAAAMARWQQTMQNYVNMANAGDNFGSLLTSMGPVAPGTPPLTILGTYDRIFANSVASYLSQFATCPAGKWDGNGNCNTQGVSGLNRRYYRRVA